MMTISITDTDYYYMVEDQIRIHMPVFETQKALPIAQNLLVESAVLERELKQYPIEGYYYKTPELKRYFTIIRNLQHNNQVYTRIKNTKNLEFLQFITSQDIWGEEKKYSIRDYDNAPLKRRYDILTLTMEDDSLFNVNSARPWNVDGIMKGCQKHVKGRVNLVELAYLTNNPKTMCCGAETNALYRMIAMISGSYFGPKEYAWGVSSKVQELGEKLIDEYNRLFTDNHIIKPSLENHDFLNKKPEKPRVTLLGQVRATSENYYWILNVNGWLEERYTTEAITTEMLSHV